MDSSESEFARCGQQIGISGERHVLVLIVGRLWVEADRRALCPRDEGIGVMDGEAEQVQQQEEASHPQGVASHLRQT